MVLDKFYEANRKSKQSDADGRQSPRRLSGTNNARIANPRPETPAPLKIPEILKINSLEEFLTRLENEQAISIGR